MVNGIKAVIRVRPSFASPERQLLFDLNDFDETLPGPWEWDVKQSDSPCPRLLAFLSPAGPDSRVSGFWPTWSFLIEAKACSGLGPYRQRDGACPDSAVGRR